MNMSNLTEHKCAGKCPEFKGEQCHHCLIQQIEKREFELGVAPYEAYVKDSGFSAGDVVVLIGEGTKDVLLEIVNHMYTPNMYRVKILESGNFGPVFKDDIRHATTAELKAKKRLPPPAALLVSGLNDVEKYHQRAIAAQGEVS